MMKMGVMQPVDLQQVLEAILDDDQDMQDMYLARRAEMAEMIAPDPDKPPDDPAHPGLANLPSISSSSAAEATLAQALQSVAASQEAPAQEAAEAAAQAAAQEAARHVLPRSNEEARSHQWHRQESGSQGVRQPPLEMGVPDQARLDCTSTPITQPSLHDPDLCQQSNASMAKTENIGYDSEHTFTTIPASVMRCSVQLRFIRKTYSQEWKHEGRCDIKTP